MPHNEPAEGSPEYWLLRARSLLNYARVEVSPREIMPADMCYSAQQAAEKAIKAVYVHCGVEFPWIHDIARLLQELPDQIDLPDHLREATDLTRYAVRDRYEGRISKVSSSDVVTAIELAVAVVVWAEHTSGLVGKRRQRSCEVAAERVPITS